MRQLLGLGASFALLASLGPAPAPSQEAAVPPPSETTAPSAEAGTPAAGAKVWVGRYEEFEEFLKTWPIMRVIPVGEGVTHPDQAFFRAGGIASRALVKPLRPGRPHGFWESYKSEIAAYKMDRLLGLDMVPVTVERSVNGRKASVQLWVEGCRLLSEIEKQDAPDPEEWNRQVYRQRVFDALIANIDRNAGNILVDDQWNIILIDHSRAFAADEMPFEDEITRLDRELFEALKTLDEQVVTEQLKPLLFGSSIKQLLKRRDKLVEKLERLAAEKGEAAVFDF
jgi:hypothetical protein